MDERAITDFAANLVPEAFSRCTSAHRVEVTEPVAGQLDFERWVEERTAHAIHERYPFGGAPCGVVEVEEWGVRWRWHREPCEELGWLTDRVREEVRDVPSPWVFVADLPRPEPRWLEVEDEVTGLIEEVLVPAASTWWMPWYAEARGRGLAVIQSGLLQLDGDTPITTAPLRAGTRFESAARWVLRGHPDRRRHRLR